MTSEDKVDWDRLQAEAAKWLSGLDCGTADREAFEAWRAADPRHAVAFAQIAHVTRTLDRVKPEYRLLDRPTVAPLRRTLLIGGGAVVAAAVVGLGAWGLTRQGRHTVKTSVGDRTSLSLPDAGHLELNTDSQAQWTVRDHTLQIWLERGEIALDLRERSLPSRLFAAGKVVAVAGSQVNARLRGELLDLAVVAGRCSVERKGSGIGSAATVVPLTVEAHQAVMASAKTEVVRPLDASELDFLSAWPRGELAFQGQTLATAVAEYNRYLRQKIVIADPSLAGIRLGGRFTTADPKPFLAALHSGFAINVIDDGSRTIALTR